MYYTMNPMMMRMAMQVTCSTPVYSVSRRFVMNPTSISTGALLSRWGPLLPYSLGVHARLRHSGRPDVRAESSALLSQRGLHARPTGNRADVRAADSSSCHLTSLRSFGDWSMLGLKSVFIPIALALLVSVGVADLAGASVLAASAASVRGGVSSLGATNFHARSTIAVGDVRAGLRLAKARRVGLPRGCLFTGARCAMLRSIIIDPSSSSVAPDFFGSVGGAASCAGAPRPLGAWLRPLLLLRAAARWAGATLGLAITSLTIDAAR